MLRSPRVRLTRFRGVQVKEAGMFAKWMRRLGMSALVGGLVWTSVGCAGERDPINRVQPNAMPKSFFLGKLGNANGVRYHLD